MSGRASLAVVTPATPAPLDWRIGRLQALMGEDWLAGEWDAERQLLLPLPGGRLSRVLRCVVEGCPSDRYGRTCSASGTGASSTPRRSTTSTCG